SADVVRVACCWPPTVDKVPEPINVDPSRKFTLPTGVPDPAPVTATVAVKVTAWPKIVEVGAAVIVVLVAAGLTVCERIALLPVKFTVSGVYTALIVWGVELA